MRRMHRAYNRALTPASETRRVVSSALAEAGHHDIRLTKSALDRLQTWLEESTIHLVCKVNLNLLQTSKRRTMRRVDFSSIAHQVLQTDV